MPVQEATLAPPAAAEVASPLERFVPKELLNKLQAARASGAMLGERRIVSILFCDLKGSTELAESVDPEDWSEIVNGAFEFMVRPVYKYEGTVARLMGDGLLAFFGAPIAHEDDPQRAVLAGLGIVAGIQRYRESLQDHWAAAVDVRVGINTGLVVVGAVGSDLRLEYTALGDAINVAARIEQAALPGTVLIAEDTYRQVVSGFEVEALGPLSLKGKSEPVMAYRVLKRRARSQKHSPSGLEAPLVNRAREMETLQRAFSALAQGRGQITFLIGEAGLGKTRLMREGLGLWEQTDGQGFVLYEAAAFSYETMQPYGLLLQLLRSALGITAADAPQTVRDQLARARETWTTVERPSHQRALETLFGLADGQEGDNLAGEAFERELLAAVEALWSEQAGHGPVVVVLDDLQWADSASTKILGQLLELMDQTAILFLCALRRDRRAPAWGFKEEAESVFSHRFAEITLHPLSDGEIRALLAGLMDGSELQPALQARILEKTEGNPLFVEEVVRSLQEQGLLVQGPAAGEDDARTSWSSREPWEEIEIPNSLQALLTARLDHLDEEARNILQVASVVGRSFSQRVLEQLVDAPERLEERMRDLQRAELVREVARLPQVEYMFQHALAHEATYNTILVKRRRELHQRVAEVMEQGAGVQEAELAPLLAYHFLEGQLPERALPYLITAGDAALRLNALGEAMVHYDRALTWDSLLTAKQLTHLYLQRGRALELDSRFQEALASYETMEARAKELDNRAMALAALIAQGKLHSIGSSLYDPTRARVLAQRSLQLAQEIGDRQAEVRVLWNLLNIDRLDVNTLASAIRHGTRAMALARELGLTEELAFILNDLGDVYTMVGQYDESGAALLEARKLWQQMNNEPMLADNLTSSALWQLAIGNPGEALALAEEAHAISQRLDNPWGQAYSAGVRGLAAFEMGELGRAIEDLETALSLSRAAGFLLGAVIAGSHLSLAHSETGALAQALHEANQACKLAQEQIPSYYALGMSAVVAAQLAAGDLESAIEGQRAGMTLAPPHEFVFLDQAWSLASVRVAFAAGQYEKALEEASAGYARWRTSGTRTWLPDVLLWRARALRAQGQLAAAQEDLQTAIALTRPRKLRRVLRHLLVELAAVEGQLGHRDESEALLAEASMLTRWMVDRLWPDELRQQFLAQPTVRDLLLTAPGSRDLEAVQ